MKLFIPVLFATALLAACESNRSYGNFKDDLTEESPEIEKSPEELRAELKASEQNSPLEYLQCGEVIMSPQQRQTRSAGLFHDAEYEADGAIFRGTISNSATLARFKDARIKILFYSRTNTLIEKQNYVIYEYLNPQSETSFSFKTEYYPEAYDSFRYELVGASVAY